ncbi:MAG TPA: branched-chain amino acid ABC transporter permease [Stellaceae bacterium]|nr:branched-chain amino acid ABC transporter permease [Stellaceae bacterium]
MQILLSGQLLFAALVTGAVYVLVAFGLNLVYGTLRLLNVAHGEIVMVGAYTSFWLFTLAHISPLISLFAAIALAAALGAAIYLGLVRRLFASPRLLQRLEANSLLLFFAFSIVLQNVAALLFQPTPRAYQYLDRVIQLGNASVTENRLVILIVAVVLCIAIILFLRLHIYGLAIKALIQHREAASVVGIDVEKVQLLSFCLGFGLAALAGSLLSMTEQISPFMGFPYTIAAFVVVILGGLGNLVGGMVASLLLGVIETYGVAFTSSSLRSVLIYGIFILVLMIRPQGLLGSRMIVR